MPAGRDKLVHLREFPEFQRRKVVRRPFDDLSAHRFVNIGHLQRNRDAAKGLDHLRHLPRCPDLHPLEVVQGFDRFADREQQQRARGVDVEGMDLVPFLGLELRIEVVHDLTCHPAVWEAVRIVENFGNGETAARVRDVRHPHVGDARYHAVVHLDRRQERSAGIVGDLHPPVGPLLDLVAEPATQRRHGVRDGEIIGRLQLDRFGRV